MAQQSREEKITPPGVSVVEVDPFLQALVAIADKDVKGTASIGVTLNIGGVLISGLMVSGRQYFEGVGTEIAEKATPETAAGLEVFFRNLVSKLYPPVEPGQEGELILDNTSLFVHLKDARFFYPNARPVPANRGVWWRGRLAAVDGFVLGTLSAE